MRSNHKWFADISHRRDYQTKCAYNMDRYDIFLNTSWPSASFNSSCPYCAPHASNTINSHSFAVFKLLYIRMCVYKCECGSARNWWPHNQLTIHRPRTPHTISTIQWRQSNTRCPNGPRTSTYIYIFTHTHNYIATRASNRPRTQNPRARNSQPRSSRRDATSRSDTIGRWI